MSCRRLSSRLTGGAGRLDHLRYKVAAARPGRRATAEDTYRGVDVHPGFRPALSLLCILSMQRTDTSGGISPEPLSPLARVVQIKLSTRPPRDV
jgi:hypothetical protein